MLPKKKYAVVTSGDVADPGGMTDFREFGFKDVYVNTN